MNLCVTLKLRCAYSLLSHINWLKCLGGGLKTSRCPSIWCIQVMVLEFIFPQLNPFCWVWTIRHLLIRTNKVQLLPAGSRLQHALCLSDGVSYIILLLYWSTCICLINCCSEALNRCWKMFTDIWVQKVVQFGNKCSLLYQLRGWPCLKIALCMFTSVFIQLRCKHLVLHVLWSEIVDLVFKCLHYSECDWKKVL